MFNKNWGVFFFKRGIILKRRDPSVQKSYVQDFLQGMKLLQLRFEENYQKKLSINQKKQYTSFGSSSFFFEDEGFSGGTYPTGGAKSTFQKQRQFHLL